MPEAMTPKRALCTCPAFASVKNAGLDRVPCLGDGLFQPSHVVLSGDGLKNLNNGFLGFRDGDEPWDDASRPEFALQRQESVGVQDQLG